MVETTASDTPPHKQVSTHGLAGLPTPSTEEQQPQSEGPFEPVLDVDAHGEKLLPTHKTAATSPIRRTNAIRSLQRLLGWTVHPSAHAENDVSGRMSDGAATDRCRYPTLPRKSKVRIDEEKASPALQLDFNPGAERALFRCFALAAAVTTWCLLQPFILFYILVHFKSPTPNHPTTVIVLPLFVLSILVGVFLGPTAVCEVLRILESRRPPSGRRYWIYGVAMLGTAVLGLMPVLLILGMR